MSDITIRDIAKLCGVGVSTVSRAMNDHPDINPETKAKIMQVIEEHNYIPNNSARNLKRTESNTIALLMKGIDNPFFQGMFRIFEEMLSQKDYSFILQKVGFDEDEINVALELEKEKKLKGIIFLGGRIREGIKDFALLNVPYILCTVRQPQRPGESPAHFVTIDDVRESFKIVDYLCSLGHRRIAIITSLQEERGVGSLRYEGYLEALKKNGITPDPALVCYMKHDLASFSAENGYAVTQELLASGTEFTAVFAASDMTAIGVCKAILESGSRIPQDYSVAGFDGLDLTHFYHPSITTIHQPVNEMAKAAVQMLFALMEGNACDGGQVFEARLEVRESTGPVKQVL